MAKRIHNKEYIEIFRKELRANLTPAEAFLWNQLKNKKFLGRKFRRQHSIDNFIVDFYCYKEKLVIELDGDSHNSPTQAAYDRLRTQRLVQLDNTVLRFENKMVFENLSSILLEIKANFDKSTSSPS